MILPAITAKTHAPRGTLVRLPRLKTKWQKWVSMAKLSKATPTTNTPRHRPDCGQTPFSRRARILATWTPVKPNWNFSTQLTNVAVHQHPKATLADLPQSNSASKLSSQVSYVLLPAHLSIMGRFFGKSLSDLRPGKPDHGKSLPEFRPGKPDHVSELTVPTSAYGTVSTSRRWTWQRPSIRYRSPSTELMATKRRSPPPTILAALK